jgi:transposase
VLALDARRFVIVDETRTFCHMTRRYGRSPRGQPAVGCVARNRGTATTLIASLTPTGMGPAMTIPGATSGAVFVEYVRTRLAPSLEPGQIVILDNVGAHLPRQVRALIEARGAEVLFLPAYSPDFSPIELAFAKRKAILRRIGATTPAALEAAIAEALAAITPDDIHGYFAHCGYDLPKGQ